MAESKELIYNILREIDKAGEPLGALYLSNKLGVPTATIGRLLSRLDYEKYLCKSSNKGRVITQKGREYLQTLSGEIRTEESILELNRLSGSTEKKNLLDMLYARRAIEMEAAALAAERITDAQAAYLESLLSGNSSGAPENSCTKDIDFDFHLAVAKISDNESYEQILKLLLVKKGESPKLSMLAKAVPYLPNRYQHSVIVEAMRSHNKELARECMKKHLDAYIDYIKDNL